MLCFPTCPLCPPNTLCAQAPTVLPKLAWLHPHWEPGVVRACADPLVALAPPTLQVEVCLELHTPHPTQDDNRLTEGSWAQQKRGWGGAGVGVGAAGLGLSCHSASRRSSFGSCWWPSLLLGWQPWVGRVQDTLCRRAHLSPRHLGGWRLCRNNWTVHTCCAVSGR